MTSPPLAVLHHALCGAGRHPSLQPCALTVYPPSSKPKSSMSWNDATHVCNSHQLPSFAAKEYAQTCCYQCPYAAGMRCPKFPTSEYYGTGSLAVCTQRAAKNHWRPYAMAVQRNEEGRVTKEVLVANQSHLANMDHPYAGQSIATCVAQNRYGMRLFEKNLTRFWECNGA